MSPYDFNIGLDGDLILENKIVQGEPTELKDCSLVYEDKLRAQIALNRIKSVKSDWFYDEIGADIEEVLGYPATEDTDKYICKKILDALTYDGYFKIEDIYIELLNKDVQDINYMVYIKTLDGNSAICISVSIDLTQYINVNLEG